MSHTIQIMQMGAQIEQLENDKKELLGIIQDKDEAIAKLKEYDDELKEKIETMKKFNPCGDWNDDVHACQMLIRQEENAELQHEINELKDILKQVLRVTWGEGWNYSLDVKVKAEKFLKE